MKTRTEVTFNARIVDYEDRDIVYQTPIDDIKETLKEMLKPGCDGSVEITILNYEVTLLK